MSWIRLALMDASDVFDAVASSVPLVIGYIEVELIRKFT